jgi:hypothetical protein
MMTPIPEQQKDGNEEIKARREKKKRRLPVSTKNVASGRREARPENNSGPWQIYQAERVDPVPRRAFPASQTQSRKMSRGLWRV